MIRRARPQFHQKYIEDGKTPIASGYVPTHIVTYRGGVKFRVWMKRKTLTPSFVVALTEPEIRAAWEACTNYSGSATERGHAAQVRVADILQRAVRDIEREKKERAQ